MTDKAAHDAVPTALRTPGLNSKDLGNIGEFWYRGRFGKGSDWSQMGVDAGSLGKSADGMPIPSTKRAPDVIDEQGRIVEVKGGAENVQNARKSDSGVTQFEDNMQMLGQTMAKDGVEREITGVRYVFVDPKGGAANLVRGTDVKTPGWLWSRIELEDELSVELFNDHGVRAVLDRDTIREARLTPQDLATWLEGGNLTKEWP